MCSAALPHKAPPSGHKRPLATHMQGTVLSQDRSHSCHVRPQLSIQLETAIAGSPEERVLRARLHKQSPPARSPILEIRLATLLITTERAMNPQRQTNKGRGIFGEWSPSFVSGTLLLPFETANSTIRPLYLISKSMDKHQAIDTTFSSPFLRNVEANRNESSNQALALRIKRYFLACYQPHQLYIQN